MHPEDISAVLEDCYGVGPQPAEPDVVRDTASIQPQLLFLTDSVPALLSYIGPDHHYRFANAAYLDWFGIEPGEVIGKHMREVIGEGAYQQVKPRITRALKGERVRHESHVNFKNGLRHIDAQLVPQFGPQGEVLGLCSLVIDVTDAKHAEKEIRDNEERFELAHEALGVVLWDWDPETNEILWSKDHAMMFGMNAGSRTMNFDDWLACVHPEDREPLGTKIAVALSGPSVPYTVELRVCRPDGSVRWIAGHGKVLKDDDGVPVRVLGVEFDITERKQAEDQLQLTQFAVENAAIAAFCLLADGRFVYVNDAACRTLGYPRAELVNMSVSDIGPEFPDETWQTQFERLRTEKSAIFESVHQHKDGRLFPVELTVKYLAYRGTEYAYAFAQDISERKDAERTIRLSEERFRSAFEDAAVGMLITTSEGDVTTVNDTLCEMLGYPATDLVGKNFSEFTHPEDLKISDDYLAKVCSGEVKKCFLKKRYLHRAGHVIWAHLSASMVKDERADSQHAIVQIQDITESERLAEQLSYQASHDPLTGLPNRRAFELKLEQVLSSCQADDESEHAFCYLDLDQFKVINDTCGHAAGDELLRQLVVMLKPRLRKRDMLARLGGDEFGLLLENCSADNAQRVTKLVREAIAEFRFGWEDKHFNIGISIGLVPFDGSRKTWRIFSKPPTAPVTWPRSKVAIACTSTARMTRRSASATARCSRWPKSTPRFPTTASACSINR